jgi:hypothetical protein
MLCSLREACHFVSFVAFVTLVFHWICHFDGIGYILVLISSLGGGTINVYGDSN